MRLLIIGTLNGQLTTATKLAMDKGATVTHAAGNAQALAVLRAGRGADLLMVDVAIDIQVSATTARIDRSGRTLQATREAVEIGDIDVPVQVAVAVQLVLVRSHVRDGRRATSVIRRVRIVDQSRPTCEVKRK